ncbi:MAG: hypothetical protein LBI41_03175 [Lactobacillales bacterium]|nr:hypothetical protein [Lactobacillales bacterium]
MQKAENLEISRRLGLSDLSISVVENIHRKNILDKKTLNLLLTQDWIGRWIWYIKKGLKNLAYENAFSKLNCAIPGLLKDNIEFTRYKFTKEMDENFSKICEEFYPAFEKEAHEMAEIDKERLNRAHVEINKERLASLIEHTLDVIDGKKEASGLIKTPFDKKIKSQSNIETKGPENNATQD